MNCNKYTNVTKIIMLVLTSKFARYDAIKADAIIIMLSPIIAPYDTSSA